MIPIVRASSNSALALVQAVLGKLSFLFAAFEIHYVNYMSPRVDRHTQVFGRRCRRQCFNCRNVRYIYKALLPWFEKQWIKTNSEKSHITFLSETHALPPYIDIFGYIVSFEHKVKYIKAYPDSTFFCRKYFGHALSKN